jgi:anthranilate phosphoribosyltransferase
VRQAVLLNAGAAFWVGGAADSLAEGVQCAARSIDSGAARERLAGLVALTQQGGTA